MNRDFDDRRNPELTDRDGHWDRSPNEITRGWTRFDDQDLLSEIEEIAKNGTSQDPYEKFGLLPGDIAGVHSMLRRYESVLNDPHIPEYLVPRARKLLKDLKDEAKALFERAKRGADVVALVRELDTESSSQEPQATSVPTQTNTHETKKKVLNWQDVKHFLEAVPDDSIGRQRGLNQIDERIQFFRSHGMPEDRENQLLHELFVEAVGALKFNFNNNLLQQFETSTEVPVSFFQSPSLCSEVASYYKASLDAGKTYRRIGRVSPEVEALAIGERLITEIASGNTRMYEDNWAQKMSSAQIMKGMPSSCLQLLYGSFRAAVVSSFEAGRYEDTWSLLNCLGRGEANQLKISELTNLGLCVGDQIVKELFSVDYKNVRRLRAHFGTAYREALSSKDTVCILRNKALSSLAAGNFEDYFKVRGLQNLGSLAFDINGLVQMAYSGVEHQFIADALKSKDPVLLGRCASLLVYTKTFRPETPAHEITPLDFRSLIDDPVLREALPDALKWCWQENLRELHSSLRKVFEDTSFSGAAQSLLLAAKEFFSRYRRKPE